MWMSRQRRVPLGILAFTCVLGLSWLALDYLIPAPPTKLTMATGPRGTGLDYFGRRYREAFARAGVDLNLHETAGSVENFKLISNPNSGVQIAIVTGGLTEEAPELLSLGMVYTAPFWIFYSSAESIDSLSQLKGKRLAIGAEGSGVRTSAERILARANVTSSTATLLPLGGRAAADALQDGKVDAAFILSPPDAPVIRDLLKNPRVRLMDFSTAEALTRIFPDLVRLSLPKGVIELEPLSPATDVTLLGNATKLIIRNDLHPAIVQLLAKTAKEIHGKPDIFQRTGEYPIAVDPEFSLSQIAIDYYKNGPSLLQEYLPFWMIVHARRVIAFAFAGIAILVPLFSFAPRMYGWFMQERIRKLYRRLRAVEKALLGRPTAPQREVLKDELAEIDRESGVISMRNSDLYFMLRYHLDRTRSRLVNASANKRD